MFKSQRVEALKGRYRRWFLTIAILTTGMTSIGSFQNCSQSRIPGEALEQSLVESTATKEVQTSNVVSEQPNFLGETSCKDCRLNISTGDQAKSVSGLISICQGSGCHSDVSENLRLSINGRMRVTVSPGEEYVLSYNTVGLGQCSIQYESEIDRGGYSLPVNAVGRASSGLVGHYLLRCGQGNAVSNDRVDIESLEAVLPGCSIVATPSNAKPGDEISLRWYTYKSDRAFLNHNIGGVALAGRQTVRATESTSFAMTVENAYGRSSCFANLDVSLSNDISMSGRLKPLDEAAHSGAALLSRDVSLLKGTTSASDFRNITDPNASGETGDPRGRQEVPCASIPRERLAVIVVAGQSNSANSAYPDAAGKFHQTNAAVYNFNIGDNKCYRAVNPLLGADGNRQSFALPLGEKLIQSGLYDAVLLVPIGVSGTWIEEWLPQAHHGRRFARAFDGLMIYNLVPTFILWHQGEANSGWIKNRINQAGYVSKKVRDALRLSYVNSFLSIALWVRERGVMAPILPAVASKCGSDQTADETRLAQLSLPSPLWKIYQGPDTDALDTSFRFEDGCHFSSSGVLVHAEQWKRTIAQYASSAPKQPPSPGGLPAISIFANGSEELKIVKGDTYVIQYQSANVSSCEISYQTEDGQKGSYPVTANSMGGARSGGAGKYTLRCLTPSQGPLSKSVRIKVGP